MTALVPPAARRRWHPVVAGTGLLVLASALAASAAAGAAGVLPAAGWPAAAGWLLAGASAGFATSGST
jgi:hypothetical protein